MLVPVEQATRQLVLESSRNNLPPVERFLDVTPISRETDGLSLKITIPLGYKIRAMNVVHSGTF